MPGDLQVTSPLMRGPEVLDVQNRLAALGLSPGPLEGNTAVGNDSNGGEVMRRQRSILQVDGFGRISG